MILVLDKPVATISVQLLAPLYPKLTIRNQVGWVRLRWFRLKGRRKRFEQNIHQRWRVVN